MAVTTTNLGVITAYGDAVAAGYTGTKAEWQALMASYATVGQQAVDAKNAAVAAKDTAVAKATEATTAATTATTKASEASASAQSIAQSASQIQENTDDIAQLKSELTAVDAELADVRVGADGVTYESAGAAVRGQISNLKSASNTDDDITWNQLSSEFTRKSETFGIGVSYTRSADKKQATFNGTSTGRDFYQIINSGIGTSIVGHKYLCITPKANGIAQTGVPNNYHFYFCSRSEGQDFGQGVIFEATSAFNMVYGIEIGNGTVFNNLTIDIPIIVDLTLCFGAGNEPTIEEFRAMFPNDYYPHDSGTQRKLTQIEKNSLDIYHNTFAVAKTQSSVKLKILTFNCGHYNYGSSTEGSWTGNTLTEKINEWKAMLVKYKPDIILGQEMSNYFDAAKTVNAIDTIFKPLLPNYYFYAWTRLLSKYSFIQTWQEDVTVTVSGTTYARSFGTAIININGVDILICSVHLPAGYTATDTTIREAMRDKLISAFANYDHVIIGGDFNESTDSFYTPFVDAGYSLGNHGYFGTITTLPNESVDNIIVKGFTFYDAVSDSADACTSDHCPIASEMHII